MYTSVPHCGCGKNKGRRVDATPPAAPLSADLRDWMRGRYRTRPLRWIMRRHVRTGKPAAAARVLSPRTMRRSMTALQSQHTPAVLLPERFRAWLRLRRPPENRSGSREDAEGATTPGNAQAKGLRGYVGSGERSWSGALSGERTRAAAAGFPVRTRRCMIHRRGRVRRRPCIQSLRSVDRGAAGGVASTRRPLFFPHPQCGTEVNESWMAR